MEERQTNYTIAECYTLPSKGKIYDKVINPNIELRSMTARDEMKRLAPSGTPLKVLADIIEGCMIEKPAIHVYDMAVADYEFLLHKLRIITYGDDYKVEIGCPHCDSVVETIAHLDELELKEFDEQTFEENRSVTLIDGRTVQLNFSTPHILEDMEAKAKELQKKFKDATMNFEAFAALQLIINTVDDVKLTKFELEDFINKLSARDMYKILNQYDKLNSCFGIDTTLDVKCSKCGGEVTTRFRFGSEFLRPTTI